MKHLSILGSLTIVTLLCLTPISAQVIWNSSSDDRAFLGVTTDEVSERKAELLGFENRYGAYITSIVEGSAAEEYGFQPLDYIVAVNDESMDWSTDLTELLENYEPGDEVTIYFYRKGKKQSKPVTLGKRRSSWNTNFSLARVTGRNDPFLDVASVRTPTLLSHGLRDYRCPQDGSVAWFSALRSLGVPTRYLRFHDEGHGIRGTDNQIFYLHQLLAWFEAHVLEADSP